MINLLPTEKKLQFILEKKTKLAMIFGFVVVTALVCIVLVLLSVNIYISGEINFQNLIFAQNQKQNQTADFIKMNGVIQKYNGLMAQMDSFYSNEIYFNQALKIITDVPMPSGIGLTNFYLKRDADGAVDASVSGLSDTRDDLLIFQKNLQSDPKIINPVFSDDSWVNSKNADFSLTFQINHNESQ